MLGRKYLLQTDVTALSDYQRLSRFQFLDIIGLKVEGYTDTTLGYGGGESSGKFEKIAAYFKKQV